MVADDDTSTADDEAEGDATTAEHDAPATRYGGIIDPIGTDVVLHTDVATYSDLAAAAKADGFVQLVDLTAVDYLTYAAPRGLPAGVVAERFEVVTQLRNPDSGERIRIRVQVPADAPAVATLFDLWPGSENLEREVYDMFGIDFVDHPDMSRILMPDDWVGHPLRKDYAVGEIPVQFKAASNIR